MNLKGLNEQEPQNLKALEVSNASLEKSLKHSLKEAKVLEAQIEKISHDLVIFQQSLLERKKLENLNKDLTLNIKEVEKNEKHLLKKVEDQSLKLKTCLPKTINLSY